MSESNPSAYKTFSWLLVILLIAVVALYNWHNENQTEILAVKDAEIARSAQFVVERERQLAQSEESSRTLRAEKNKLTGELDAANQARLELQEEREALQVQHAQNLAAEQKKARQVYAELQGRHEAANAQIATLDAKIEQLQQTADEEREGYETRLADAEATHKAQMLQLERQMREKTDFYRTALEGSDPERAAQLVGLELQLQDNRKTIDEARQAMQSMREKMTDLETQLAGANQVIVEREQALSNKGQELEAIQADLAQEQSAHRTLQQEFQTAKAISKKTQTEAAAAMKAANEAHAARMADAEDRISDLTANLQAETAALGKLQKEHDTLVTRLRDSIEVAEKTLAGVEAELSTTKEAAAQAQQLHELQVSDAKTKISELEQTLDQASQEAAEDLANSRREREEAVAYVREIYREFAKLGGQHTNQGMLLSLAEDELHFRIGKADLPDGELQSLEWIAALLAKHPQLTARIEGHTDSKGREETNLELSRKRADAVKQALVERGVDPQRMTTEGIGEARPIADNTGAAGRRENRRVEIYIVEN